MNPLSKKESNDNKSHTTKELRKFKSKLPNFLQEVPFKKKKISNEKSHRIS